MNLAAMGIARISRRLVQGVTTRRSSRAVGLPPLARTWAAAAIAFLTATWASVGVAGPGSLQADIETILAEEGLAGIAWALVKPSGEVQLGAAGLRDKPGNAQFSADTRVHVGSLTKAVLATGLLRLVTEGRIDLDAPVLGYLPTLFEGEAPSGFSTITVRHLLDHTSSLNDADLWQMFSERASADAALVAAFPHPNEQLQVRALPGSRFSYSNIGYTLLGMILESVTGERYETYLDRELLAPLAMHDSTFLFTTQAAKTPDPALAWGHVDDGSRYAAMPMFLRPAGQFTTTAGDLGRFALFLMGNGRIDNEVFIRPDLMAARGKPRTTLAAGGGLAAGYTLGLGRRDRHGVVGYCHGGNIVGFVAMLCVFPEQHLAFAYSVNTDSETANYGRLDARFIDALGVANAVTPATRDAAPDARDWVGRYVLSPNRFQMFDYLDRLFGSVRVDGDANGLEMTSLQGSPRQLRPTGGYLYTANDRTTTSHVLLRGAAGEHLISDGFQTFRKVSPAYLLAHWASLLLGLGGLLWILLAGTAQLLTQRSAMLRSAAAPAYLSLLLLPVPVPLFFSQSFMALGDMTLASVTLAAATALIPLGMLLSLAVLKRQPVRSSVDLLWGAAAICVLQWCVVLAVNGMLPFRLWS